MPGDRMRRVNEAVSVLGEAEERQRSLAGLESSHGVLQASIARELRLKRTPTLEFLYDDSVDRSMRIAELLERENRERS